MTALTAIRRRLPGPGRRPAAPPAGSVPAAGRPPRRWPAAAAAAACGAALAVAGIWLAGAAASHPAAQHHPAAASAAATTPAASAPPSPATVPTTGMLTIGHLRAGDCVTGSDLKLNDPSAEWPALVQAVPCSQAHTAEVVYTTAGAWPATEAFPGVTALNDQGDQKCDAAFQSYDGTPVSQSVYSLIPVIPSDPADWKSGDRSLQCIAWQATTADPAGAPLYGTLRGTRQ
jgi:hypothetical protein